MASQLKLKLFVALLSAILTPLVQAHGQVNRVVANGVTNEGGNIYYAGDAKNKATAVRIQYKASSPAYNLPKDFTDNSKMACETASGAPKTIKVSAGSKLQIYWQGATSELLNHDGTGGLSKYNPWVHAMGPIMDYMADCNGDCSKFDAANAGWTKIANSGIDLNTGISSGLKAAMAAKPENYYPTKGNGLWAMAKLVQQGSRWDITIPKSVKNGQYIVRNEMAAIHSPLGSSSDSGPQMYVACVQVEVVDGGSASLPSGTKAGSLYSPTGDFAKFNVYRDDPSTFKVPGPAVWDGASDSGSNSGSSGSAPSSSSRPSASSSATASSAPHSASPSPTSTGSGPGSGSSQGSSGSGSGSSGEGNNAPASASSTGGNTTLTSSAGSSTTTGRCKQRRSIPKSESARLRKSKRAHRRRLASFEH